MSDEPLRPFASVPDSILPRLSASLLDQLVGESPLSVLLVKRGFPSAVVYANLSIHRLLGVEPGAIAAMDFPAFCDHFLNQVDHKRVRETVDVGLAHSFSVEFMATPRGSLTVSLDVVPLPDDRGLLSHCALVIGRTPTSDQAAPAESVAPPSGPTMPSAESLLSVLAELYQQIPVGLALVDPTGRLRVANRAFAACLGLSPETLHAQPALEEISAALALASRVPAAATAIPVSLPSATGKPKVFELTLGTVPIGAEPWQLLTLHDVRARDAANALREETRRLESLGTFASGIAHDFNNLLTIILGYGGLIRDQADPSGSVGRATSAILDAGKRGADIVRQLQLFAHQYPPEYRRVDFHALIEEAVAHAFPCLPEGITLDRDFTPRPFVVELDSSQMLLGLRHLLQNGRDAMQSGGALTLRTLVVDQKASPGARQPATLVLSIIDDGPEMDEARRAKLFDPFSAPQSRAGTRGLGLAVVYGIMRAHQGRIEVAAELGRGNRIDLHFPCRTATAVLLPPEPAALTPPLAPGTVLIVEDEVDIGRLWEGLFTSHGIPHVWARDGDEALTLFHRHRHDIGLLLTDVGLPGMSGWKLAQSLRELDPHLPILITSGAFQPNDRTASGLAEPLVCLSKPFFPSAVIQQVQRLTANQPLTVTAHHR